MKNLTLIKTENGNTICSNPTRKTYGSSTRFFVPKNSRQHRHHYELAMSRSENKLKCKATLSTNRKNIVCRESAKMHNNYKVPTAEIYGMHANCNSKQKTRNNPKQKIKAIFDSEIDAIYKDQKVEFNKDNVKYIPVNIKF
jgi:hypothetical protein